MNNKAAGAMIIVGVIIGAALAGLSTGVYFLRASNNSLEAQLNEKQAAYYALVTQVQDLEAESERLKTTLPVQK